MTQRGETEHFSDSDHVEVLHRHLGRPFIDTVLVNIEKRFLEEYMDTNRFDEYLVQVEHDFAGLCKQVLVWFHPTSFVWKMEEPSMMAIWL